MPHQDPHIPIARKIREIETTKIGIVRQAAEVLQGVHTGNDKELAGALGGLVGLAYLLAKQMGIPLEALEHAAVSDLPHRLHLSPADEEDYLYVARYLASKR